MYMGLMKRGVSFMALFFACIAFIPFFSNFLFILFLAFSFAVPLIWFAAFFDFWRYPRMTQEQKDAVQDGFLFTEQAPRFRSNPAAARKVRLGVGIVLILAGLSSLYSHFVSNFLWRFQDTYPYMPPLWVQLLQRFPMIAGAVLVIAIGLVLIFWKAKQIKKQAVQNDEE